MSEALPSGERAEAEREAPQRILSLFLPRLPTDRLIRRRAISSDAPPEGRPLAVVAKIKNALRVVAIDESAEGRGVRLGTNLADAQAALPDLFVAEADEAADRALLETFADWADRYTPLVALDPPDGLFLDISGCAHLFTRGGDDGEQALLADCLHRLARQGFAARGAVASTAGAASAFARYGAGGVVPVGFEAEAIADLPVAALRIDAEAEALLDRLGLRRIGQLIGKPRAPLAARFGIGLVTRLDQALGHLDEVLSPRRPAPRLSAERRFAEPVVDEASLLLTVASLARTLSPALERHGLGARFLEAAFYRTDGAVSRAVVGTAAPLRRAEDVAALFSERLAALGSEWDAGFGFDMVRLAVLRAEPLDAAQIDLSGEADEALSLARLYDRLGARLGTARITRFEPLDTHIPERAIYARPLVQSAQAASTWAMPVEVEAPVDRPLRMFASPEPVEVLAGVPDGPPLRFRWRRVVHEVARAEGPERIAPEWWRAEDSARLTRDYFRVEDRDGRRYWLFREGLYGRETASPHWYLHGLFG
jgi:protein ImuB